MGGRVLAPAFRAGARAPAGAWWAAGLVAAGLLGAPVRAAAPEALFARAKAAAREGRHEEALTAYAAILNTRGEDAAVRHNRALSYLALGESAAARREARRAVALSPERGDYLVTLAVTDLVGDKPRLKRASATLLKAVRRFKRARDRAGLANAYYNLGYVAHKRLALEEARAYYRKALEANPTDERVIQALGSLEPEGGAD